MTSWHVIEVASLPDIKDAEDCVFYQLPNGEVWTVGSGQWEKLERIEVLDE